MVNNTETENLLEYMPTFKVWYKALLVYIFQLIIFILAFIFFWWISSTLLLGAIFGQLIIAFLGTVPYIYIAGNSEKIRSKYLKRYGKSAGQYFWYRYHSYIIPLQSASLYFPLLLKTDYFLPAIIQFPSHFLTKSLLPIFIALPLSITLVVFGLFIRRASRGFGSDEDHFLYMIYPQKGRLITQGIYRFIRHPRFLCRITITIGFGIFANNLMAIGVVLIHLVIFYLLLIPEDKELGKRFSEGFLDYKNKVPSLFPRFGTWRNFIRFISSKRKK